jgi:phosphatidylethanolamine-binding protein (PEBP) family uncharacterized protein
MIPFTVQYGQANANGKTLSKQNTVNPPVVLFSGEDRKLYTLVMSDPDAAAKSWLHWLITNIPGEANDVMEGQVVMPYTGPNPPSGIHRYIFTLYEQPAGSIMVAKPSERGNFPVVSFERQFGLTKIATRIVKSSSNGKN